VLVCGECSAHNADGESFCGSCGAYLGWQAELESHGNKSSTIEPHRGAQTAPQTVMLPEVPVGDVVTGQRRVPAGAAPTEPVSTIDGEPAPVQPGELIEGAPSRPRRNDGISPDAGPLVCATCGTRNKADQNFCRRCAVSLAPAAPYVEAAPRQSWWQRLFGRPGQKVLPAGTRPLWKTRRFPIRFVVFLAVLGLAGGVASANRDAIGGAPLRILDEIRNDHKKPLSTVASGEIDEHEAKFATDGRVDNFWAAQLKSGKNANFLEAKFREDIRLVYVFITAQPSKHIPKAGEQAPSKILISVHHKGAKAGLYQEIFPEIKLPNDPKRYGFYVGADNVESVRLTILEPTSTTSTKAVFIADVQFTGW
jgi:hypothetical protein